MATDPSQKTAADGAAGQREAGVVFPDAGAGRSTSALGREVVCAALREVDPVGARAAQAETSWRRDYRVHFRRLVEAGLLSPQSAVTIARDGLAAVHERMAFATVDGDVGLGEAMQLPVPRPLQTATITGEGDPERELVVPYRGERLAGGRLRERLEHWVGAGIIEPSCAEAVTLVAENPQWLALPGHRVAVLGAAAEMGPLTALLRWGAEVVAVDLPRPDLWHRLLVTARRYAGALHAPAETPHDLATATGVGADLLHEPHRVAAWLSTFDTPMTVGSYAYADGGLHVRVSAAVDALTRHLLTRPGIGLAFLATPTDAFVVPAEAVAESGRRYDAGAGVGRMRRPLRVLSAGRLFARNYPPGAEFAICDSLVLQQGPNYALAKRIQRWRAAVARSDGHSAFLRVAPATRTRSVLRNRLLAAAYAGAHRFGIEIFEPATSNTLMAALLVHDICAGPPAHPYPWQDEAFAAAHGGLWRQPYAPRSVLGIAVLLGGGAARG